MKSPVVFVCGSIVLFLAATAHAASFSLTSGTLHATAGTVNFSPNSSDTPGDVALTPANSAGSVYADVSTLDFGPPAIDLGNFRSWDSFGSTNINFSFNGNCEFYPIFNGTPKYGGGSGSIDLKFHLDTPSAIQLQSTANDPSITGFSFAASLRDSSNNTVFTFTTNSNTTTNLPAGDYDIVASAGVGPHVGNPSSGAFFGYVNVVPEPTCAALLCALAILPAMRRRRM